jgi:hypothetical protein
MNYKEVFMHNADKINRTGMFVFNLPVSKMVSNESTISIIN